MVPSLARLGEGRFTLVSPSFQSVGARLRGEPVPVYLTYFTAAVDPTAALLRLPDRYGWDSRLRAALAAPGSP